MNVVNVSTSDVESLEHALAEKQDAEATVGAQPATLSPSPSPSPSPSALSMAHYDTGDVLARVEAALKVAGLGQGLIPWEELASFDQFHIRGAAATGELAARLKLSNRSRVLDVGCGLGGPARHLAAVHGADVTGIDLHKPFIDVAVVLTERTGLAQGIHFVHGDAASLRFEEGRFDVVITQHVAMNVADKPMMYAGIRRVLRPGGMLGIYDVIVGDGTPLRYPVPWARSADQSFLANHDSLEGYLEAQGFVVRSWVDQTALANSWWSTHMAARGAGEPLPARGLSVVMGPAFQEMAFNLGRNLADGKLRVVQIVAERAL